MVSLSGQPPLGVLSSAWTQTTDLEGAIACSTDLLANQSRLVSSSTGQGLLLLASSPARAQDAWDAVFLKGNKIGYVHTFIEKVSEKGGELYRVRQDQVFTFRRLEDTVTMKMMYGTIETPMARCSGSTPAPSPARTRSGSTATSSRAR